MTGSFCARQVALDDVQVGPADAAATHVHAHSPGRLGRARRAASAARCRWARSVQDHGLHAATPSRCGHDLAISVTTSALHSDRLPFLTWFSPFLRQVSFSGWWWSSRSAVGLSSRPPLALLAEEPPPHARDRAWRACGAGRARRLGGGIAASSSAVSSAGPGGACACRGGRGPLLDHVADDPRRQRPQRPGPVVVPADGDLEVHQVRPAVVGRPGCWTACWRRRMPRRGRGSASKIRASRSKKPGGGASRWSSGLASMYSMA